MAEDVEALVRDVVSGERRALARAITLLESSRPEDRRAAGALFEGLLPHAGRSVRLGVSGPPGAGKSTLVDALGTHATTRGERVAVLAVDPSSALHGGSLLGDKTRMVGLSRTSSSFIRPSPARSASGGVGARTQETISLCEAAGYSLIIVETLGVGQGEHVVADMVDCLVLVLVPGTGDDVQGMKRGILDLCDLVAINKADGPDAARAEHAKSELEGALALFHHAGGAAGPPVLLTSALERRGIDALWLGVVEHVSRAEREGQFERRRARGRVAALERELRAELTERFLSKSGARDRLAELTERVRAGGLSPRRALEELLGD